jgi:hydrogenase 3 maturation protease
MCIGNRFGGDDAVGPYIADELKKGKLSDIKLIDCGTTPENYTSIVKKENPENLIIIDAVEMNLPYGEIRLISKEKIGKFCISTHGIPISLIIDYLEKYIDNIFFIGIQPKKMNGELTNIVKKSADVLIKLVLENNIESIKKL